MTEQNLFETPQDEPTVDPNKDYHAELVGEGKRYADDKILARSKIEADLTITRQKKELEALQAQIRGLAEKGDVTAKLDNLIAQLSQVKQPASNDLPPENHERGDAPKGISPEDVKSLLASELAERELQTRRRMNVEKVTEELVKTFGPDYSAKLKEKAKTLGVGEQWLNTLAAEQPTAFLNLVGAVNAKSEVSVFTPPASSRTTQVFTPTVGERTQAYYESIRKSDPKRYEALTVERHNMALKLGERFFDLD